MGNLNQIEKSAQKLIALCQKEKLTKTDKEKMHVLHAEILSTIEDRREKSRKAHHGNGHVRLRHVA